MISLLITSETRALRFITLRCCCSYTHLQLLEHVRQALLVVQALLLVALAQLLGVLQLGLLARLAADLHVRLLLLHLRSTAILTTNDFS